MTSFYYGFTKRTKQRYKYQTPRPELENEAIYFSSNRGCLSEIDITKTLTGWFVDDFLRDEYSGTLGYHVPPSPGDFVVGLVSSTEKGPRFSKFFLASPQFAKLFYYVMDCDYDCFPAENDPRRDQIFVGLDCAYMFLWQKPEQVTYRHHEDSEHCVATKSFISDEARLDWMSRPSFNYDEPVRYGHHMLYYVYQIVTIGKVVDFRDDPAERQRASDCAKAFFYNVGGYSLKKKELESYH
jgi:hypothetical protein